MNTLEVRKLMTLCKGIWQRTFDVPSDPTSLELMVAAWHDILSDTPYDAAWAAAKRLSSQQYPAPVGLIRDEANAIAGKPVLDAEQAPGEVLRLVKKFGWPNEGAAIAEAEQIDPALVYAINALGGWLEVCKEPDPMTSSTRAQIREAFKRGKERHERNQSLDELRAAGLDTIGRHMDEISGPAKPKPDPCPECVDGWVTGDQGFVERCPECKGTGRAAA